MKKNIYVLIGAIAFLSYEIYITYKYIWYLVRWDSYGNVFKDIMIIPHFFLLFIGTIFHFIYFFKPKKWMLYTIIGCYVVGGLFLII